jgi:hypothetical protein
MLANITQACSAKQCIGDGMQEHIGVRMTQQSFVVRNVHAA